VVKVGILYFALQVVEHLNLPSISLLPHAQVEDKKTPSFWEVLLFVSSSVDFSKSTLPAFRKRLLFYTGSHAQLKT
jgi:hypothetical protein